MQTKVINYYDDESGELVTQKFFIDNEEVSVEDYIDFTEDEEDFEDFEDDGCDGDCENCEVDDEEDTLDEVIDDYIELIQEASPCPYCLRELLESFAEELLDFVEIEDED